jgi:hypothetical protein
MVRRWHLAGWTGDIGGHGLVNCTTNVFIRTSLLWTYTHKNNQYVSITNWKKWHHTTHCQIVILCYIIKELTKDGGDGCTSSTGSFYIHPEQYQSCEGPKYKIHDGHGSTKPFTSTYRQEVANYHTYSSQFNSLKHYEKFKYYLLSHSKTPHFA